MVFQWGGCGGARSWSWRRLAGRRRRGDRVAAAAGASGRWTYWARRTGYRRNTWCTWPAKSCNVTAGRRRGSPTHSRATRRTQSSPVTWAGCGHLSNQLQWRQRYQWFSLHHSIDMLIVSSVRFRYIYVYVTGQFSSVQEVSPSALNNNRF